MIDSWNFSASKAVTQIFETVNPEPAFTLTEMRNELDQFIISLYTSPGGSPTAIRHWTRLGALAVQTTAVRSKPFTVAEVTETLIRKQRDYGPENIRRFGRQGLMVRMHDKIARLENLETTGRSPDNETVVDNLLDVVGYAAIGIMWETGTFLNPLE